MVLQVGIHCSRRDMGRKKGGMVQNDASLESVSSIGVKKASSPLQLDKTGSSTLINIAAKPGARHSSITDYSEECVGVAIGAAAVGGAANKELVEYLANVLQVKKSAVSLEAGARGRIKLVRVAGLTPVQVEALLQTAL